MPVIGDAILRITADTRPFRRTIASLEVAGVGLFASIGSFAATTAVKIGKTMALLSGAAVAGVTAAFASFEQAFAGVARTVEATAEELAAIRKGILDLSKTIPIAANELAEIGLVAGQLGIAAKDVVAFTEVAAKLGVVTELSSTEAAEGLARVSQITGLLAEDFDNLASVLVDLGNKFVSTEGDILKLSIRIAGAANVIGIAAQEVLGIGNAFASIVGPSGLEAAGTAIQKVFLAMLKATREGGKGLALFAKTAGVSVAQFKKLFAEDPAELFTLFVEGLGKAGKGAIDILTELELKDARLIRTFLQVAGAGDILRRSIAEANREFTQNIALEKEFAKFADTIKSQFQILKNQIFAAAFALGELLRPGLIAGMKRLGQFIERMVGALQSGVKAFGSAIPVLVDLLGTGLLGIIRGIGTSLQFFADFLSGFAPIIKELGAIVGEFASTVFSAFSDALFKSREPIRSIVESFGILADFAGDELALLLGAIADILPAVADGFAALFEIADPVFREILEIWVPALKTLLTDGIFPAILALAEGLAPVFLQVGKALATIVENLAPVIRLLGESLGGAVRQLADPFSQLLLALGTIAGTIGTTLSEVVTALAPLLGTLFTSAAELAEPLIVLIETFGDAFVQLLGAVGPVLVALVPALKGLTPALVTVIKTIGKIGEILADAFVVMIEEIGPTLPALLQSIAESAAILAPALADMVVALSPVFADVLRAIAPELPNIAAAFADLVIALTPLIPLLGDILVSLTDLFTRILIPSVIDALTTLVDAFTSLPDPLQKILVIIGAGGWVAPKIFGFLGGLATRVGGLFGPTGLINSAMTTIGVFGLRLEEMGGPIGRLGTRLSGLGDIMTGSVSGAVSRLGGAFTTQLTGVAGGTVGILGAVAAGIGLGVVLHNLIEDHFPGINRALEDVGGAISDFLLGTGEAGQIGLIGEIGEFFTGLGEKIFDAIGKALITILNFFLNFKWAFPDVLDNVLESAKDDLQRMGFHRGGRPRPGALHIVGERGPELRVDDSAGTIFTTGDLHRLIAALTLATTSRLSVPGDIDITVYETHPDARHTAWTVGNEIMRRLTP